MPRTHARIGFALAASLALGVLGGTPALAANTRVIYFGSPPVTGTTADLGKCDPTTGFCPLVVPTVSAVPGQDAVDVVVENLGGQTVNHVTVYGGAQAESSFNPLFPQPAGNSLPGDHGQSSFIGAYPKGACTISTIAYADGSGTFPNDSIACAVGQLNAGASATFRIAISVPPANLNPYSMWLEVDLNEGTSTTGTNQDTFYATGSLTVGTATCDFNSKAAGFFLDTQKVNVGTPSGCTQSTSLASGFTIGGTGAFATVYVQTGSGNTCPKNISCFGNLSAADVNGGNAVPGGLQWTITWSPLPISGQPKGVIHELLGYDPTNPATYELIYFTGKYKCSTTLTTKCWISNGPITGGFQAVVVTPNNGFVRGF